MVGYFVLCNTSALLFAVVLCLCVEVVDVLNRRRLKRQRMAERVDKCIWRITPSPEREAPKQTHGRVSEDE